MTPAGAPEAAIAPDLVGTIRAIVRDQLAATRVAELGVVTDVFPHAAESDSDNYECAVRLRDSGLDLPRVAVATGRVGLAAIPNVGDLVLVTFVGGDVHAPVVIGRLYNGDDRPPTTKATELVYVSPDQAQSGIRRASLQFPNGNSVELDDDKMVISLGSTKVTIDNAGDVQIQSNGKVEITSSGDTKVTSGADLSLEAGGSLTIKAQGQLKVQGLTLSAKADAALQLEGGSLASLKGPMVNVSGLVNVSSG